MVPQVRNGRCRMTDQAVSTASGWILLGRQVWGLTIQRLLVRLRSWQLNLALALSSVAVVFLIWAVNAALTASSTGAAQFSGAGEQRHPAAVSVADIPDCSNNIFLRKDRPCLAFLYTPAGDTTVEAVVSAVLRNNNPPLSKDAALGLNTSAEADAYLLANPQTVLGAVHFRRLDSNNPWAYAYILQSNDSVAYFKGRFQDPNTYIQLPLQVAVEREFARLALGDPSMPYKVAVRNFPHPSLTTSSPVGRVAPVFILASLMFNVVLLIQTVVGERETGVRGVMTAMGLKDSAYWTAVVVPEFLLIALHATLLTLLCMAFRFDMAVYNSPALLFVLLLCSAMALGAAALMLATLLRKAAQAVPTSLVAFIVAWIFLLVLSFGLPYNGSTSKGLVALFSLFPWSLLGKGLLDLADATTGTSPGISWGERWSYCQAQRPAAGTGGGTDGSQYLKAPCSMPLGEAYLVLLLQTAGYLVLALYLDSVVPHEAGGTARPWYFPVLPSTWGLDFWSRRKGTGLNHNTQDLRHVKRALQLAEASKEQPAAAAGPAKPQQQAPASPAPAATSSPTAPPPLPPLAEPHSAVRPFRTPAWSSPLRRGAETLDPSYLTPAAANIPGACNNSDLGLPAPQEPSAVDKATTAPAAGPYMIHNSNTTAVKESTLPGDADVEAEAARVQALCKLLVKSAAGNSASAAGHSLRRHRRGHHHDNNINNREGGGSPSSLSTSSTDYNFGSLDRISEGSADSAAEQAEAVVEAGVILAGLTKAFRRPAGRVSSSTTTAAAGNNKEGHQGKSLKGSGHNSRIWGDSSQSTSILQLLVTLITTPPWHWGGVMSHWWAMRSAAGRFVAVHPLWLALEQGQCFCLLGPNGAGKTTTFKCLTGAVHPSGGDALVCGNSVRSSAGLTRAHALTGVCPQFDLLIPQLTGREHLWVHAHLKGLPLGSIKAEADTLLAKVGLTAAADVRAGAYSGGMRRRLSLAVALLGDPALLVLDEPTTGLDPVSRRQVWRLLSSVRRGRCVLLTTHSMEEADVLGDRIGIIAAGALRCLGSSLHLKSRFGAGLRLCVGLTSAQGPGLAPLTERIAQVQHIAACLQLGSSRQKAATAVATSSAKHIAHVQQHTVDSGRNGATGSSGAGVGVRSIHSSGAGASSARKPSETTAGELEGGTSGVSGSSDLRPTAPADAAGPTYTGTAPLAGVDAQLPGTPQATEAPATSPTAPGAGASATHYERFLVDKEAEQHLPALFAQLEEESVELGIVDLQLGLAPLEEVFLRVVTGAAAG